MRMSSGGPMLAYLVIREGSKWNDVFRLVPGQTVTIGRAPANRIVLKDERCSRFHAEVLLASNGQWILRDLGSRNGTLIGDQAIHGEFTLTPGDIARIGNTQLAFVHELSQAFPDSSTIMRAGLAPTVDVSQTSAPRDSDPTGYEPTTITHRRAQTKFLEPADEDDEGGERQSRAAAKLCRLAFELAKAPDASSVAKLA